MDEGELIGIAVGPAGEQGRDEPVEPWLVGRRMFDLRRWQEEDIPGEPEDTSMRVRHCFPVPNAERNNNPNIPE